jgi:uncharacterized protein (DUF924 family)
MLVPYARAMPDALETEYQPILTFWFGALDSLGRADAAHSRRWFVKDEAFDRELAQRFGATHTDVAAGRHEAWLAEPRGRVAYVIVLDQLSRNMFRGTARAFETDAQALQAAARGIEIGADRDLALDERWFLYMPFMHSEDLVMQDRAVALFSALAVDAPPALREQLTSAANYARQHREIVARFGRFPHRNAVLGRPSTPEEAAFLQQPGSSF